MKHELNKDMYFCSRYKNNRKADMKNIVIVHDSENIIEESEVISDVLESSEVHIIDCVGIQDAIKEIEKKGVSLILLDCGKDIDNGIQNCQKLKSNKISAEIPVILMASIDNTENTLKAFKAGAVDFISKPFSAPVLKARVRTHIELQQARDKYVELNELLKYEIELRKDVEKQLLESSIRDPLTNLYNRMKLLASLEDEMTRSLRYKDPLSIIILDVDNFKQINDQFGHHTGDMVLIELSRRISNSIRNCDVFARWGGEEFIILLPHTEKKMAAELAERLRQKLEEKDFDDAGRVTASFGVSMFRDGDGANSFINRADERLYIAKQNGRNRVVSES